MSLMGEFKLFKMTTKTHIFLFFYGIFGGLSQWFIKHCDYENYTYEEYIKTKGMKKE